WQDWPIINLTIGQLCPVTTTQTTAAAGGTSGSPSSPSAGPLTARPPWAVCEPTVSLDSFGSLGKLRHLDLSRNGLGRLEGGRPLFPVEELDLSYNALTAVPDLGRALPGLRKLILDGNRIGRLQQGALEGLDNLSELSIRGNALARLTPRIFHPLHNLLRLNLASNLIRQLPSEAADDLGHLEELDLSHNLLPSLPPSLLQNATPARLALYGNPWNCDGRHRHLARWIRANPGKLRGADGAADETAAVCSAPLRLNGVPLVRLPLIKWTFPFQTTAAAGGTSGSPSSPSAGPLTARPPWAVCEPLAGRAGKVGLNCSHRSLQSVPPSLPDDTEILLLSSNSISTVSLDSFGSLGKLRHLDLSRNGLGRLEGGRPLFPVEELDLSYNALTAVPDLGRSLPGLRKLILDGNRIGRLQQGALEGLDNLSELSIRGNALARLTPRIFHPLHNLRRLNLASNLIRQLPSENATPARLALYGNPWNCDGRHRHLARWIRANPGKLRGADGAADETAAVCSAPLRLNGVPLVRLPLIKWTFPFQTTAAAGGTSGSPSSPSAGPLTARPPWAVCEPLAGRAGKVGLNCSHRSLQSVPPSLPDDTEILLLSSNSISTVSLDSFGSLGKLRHLDLSRNGLGRLEGGRPLFPVEELDLSYNALTAVPDLGRSLPGLRKLILDGNRIGRLQQGALEGLDNLSELSIRGNALARLTPRIFHPLHNLRRLNLASNLIRQLPSEAADDLGHLEELDLSHNLLPSLPPSLLQNATPARLALYGNPWNCDGRHRHLARWIRANPGKLRGADGAADETAAVCSAPLRLNGVPLVRLPLIKWTFPFQTTAAAGGTSGSPSSPSAGPLTARPPWAVCEPLAGRAGKVGLNCSHRSLQSVPPSLPDDTEILLLSSNSISTVSLDSFGSLGKLRHLDLSRNGLGRLEGGRPLFPVEELDLSYNALTAVPDLGRSLPGLRKLILDGNRIGRLQQGALEGLDNLSELSIRGNALARLTPRIFHPLHNLRRLNLASNLIRQLPSEAADDLGHLEELDLSHNLLPSLPPSLLQNATPARLALYGNPWNCDGRHRHLARWIRANPGKLRGADGAADETAAVCSAPLRLNGVPLVRLPLIKWTFPFQTTAAAGGTSGSPSSPSAGPLTARPPWAVCEPLAGRAGKVGLNCSHRSLQSVPPSLPDDTEILLLSSNSISTVSLDSFGSLGKLRHLDLSRNGLGRLEGGRPLFPLEELDLSYNALTAVPDLGRALPGLRKLILDGNRIGRLQQGALEGLDNLSELSIRGNALIKWTFPFQTTAAAGGTSGSPSSPSAGPLTARPPWAVCEPTVSLDSFGSLGKLRHLDLSRNGLGRLEGGRPLFPVEELDLSYNALTAVPDLGRSLPGLRKLILDGNRIGRLQQGALEGLDNLSELSIRGNALARLTPRIFHPLHNLRRLNLASNLIRQLPSEAADDLGHLEELDLSHNLLPSLPPSLLQNATPARLALYGNPWNCDGRHRHLARWIRANPGKLRGADGAADETAAVCSAPLRLNGVPLVRLPLAHCPDNPPTSLPPSTTQALPGAAKPVDGPFMAWARGSGLLLAPRGRRGDCWPLLLLHGLALSLVALPLCGLSFYTLGFYRRLCRPLKRHGRGVRLVRYSLVLPDLRQVYPPPSPGLGLGPGPRPGPGLGLGPGPRPGPGPGAVELTPLLGDRGYAGSPTQGEADTFTSSQ
ncbi:uncharacterized protein LOC144591776, partial [Rhinoraja longicauda]